MQKSTRQILIGVCVLFFGIMLWSQSQLDPVLAANRQGEKTTIIGLSNEFILGPLLGLQQAVAGALWVRADEFFHSGDYDAILPIVRMVTWLDPHSLDVYITGGWHLAYNFTDSNERSDRRYIPAAQALLREGYENNKNVYDIAFEVGWQNFDKIKNYEEAEKWFRIALTGKAPDEKGVPNQPAPMFVRHQIAHQLERQGRIDEACAEWRACIKESMERLEKDPNDFSKKNTLDSEKHNLELTLLRNFSRYKHSVDFNMPDPGHPQMTRRPDKIDPETGEPSPAEFYKFLSGPNVGQARPPAIEPPYDTHFDCRIKFPQPKNLEIYNGHFDTGDGARVTVRLHDANWFEQVMNTFSFDIDQTQTIMQDAHSVRDKTWGRKVDMSKDPKMYSFSSPEKGYYLVLEFNPRGTSPHIQDRFGYNGEGMTDAKYLKVIKADSSEKKDLRILRKIYHLTQAQVLGQEPVTESSVISNEEYDRIQQENANRAAKSAAQ